MKPRLAARAQALRFGGWRLELVVRRIPEARDMGVLMENARARGERLPGVLLRAAGALVRRMHDQGFLHADLQPNNLLVVGEPSSAQLVVLDLEFNRQLIFRQCSKSVIDFEIGSIGLLLSTNGGKRYPFTFFGIEFGIGSFSWHPDRLEKRSNKRILVMLE